MHIHNTTPLYSQVKGKITTHKNYGKGIDFSYESSIIVDERLDLGPRFSGFRTKWSEGYYKKREYPMQGIIIVEDSRTARAVAQRFIRGFGIAGLAAIASLGLADRVNATSVDLDCVPAPTYAEQTLDYDRWYGCFNAGHYIDREWYHLLDNGQYQYLDRGQYNLLGELGYLLGHPCYPKLFERDSDQAVGFTNRQHTAWFSFGGGQVPINEYVWSRHFNAGDYVDKWRYHFLDRGQYYYLDRGQYNWLGNAIYCGFPAILGRPRRMKLGSGCQFKHVNLPSKYQLRIALTSSSNVKASLFFVLRKSAG